MRIDGVHLFRAIIFEAGLDPAKVGICRYNDF